MSNLIDRIINYIGKTETTSLTALGKTWVFRKKNGVVFLEAPGDGYSAVSGLNTIGTLPEGFRPINTVRIPCGNEPSLLMFLQISNAGVVQLYRSTAISAAYNCSFSTSYIAAAGGGLKIKSRAYAQVAV